MSTNNRILLYNWVPAFDRNKLGGGVPFYRDNCIDKLLSIGWRVDALSSGLAYDVLAGRPYIREVAAKRPNHTVFELVNSPIPSPAELTFFIDNFAFRSIL